MYQSIIAFFFSIGVYSAGDIPADNEVQSERVSYEFAGEGVIVIPFKRSNNLILVEASIDTISGNFVLDTGAPGLILNKTYFRSAWTSDSYQATSATGALTTAYKTTVKNFNLNELHVDKITAELSELSHIENQRNVKILGLLGVGLFTSYEIRIDWRKSVLYLLRPGNKWKGVHKPTFILPFELLDNSIIIEGVVNEKKLNFCFDTGAEVGVLSNLVSKKVLESFKIRRRMTMLGTSGSRREVLVGSLNEITFGPLSVKNMNTVIARLDGLSEAYGRSLDGMIGYNILTKGIISINFASKELQIFPFEETDK